MGFYIKNEGKIVMRNCVLSIEEGNRWKDIAISFLVVTAGVTINLPVPYFKYVFLLFAFLLSIISLMELWSQKSLSDFVKSNFIFVLLSVYVFLLVGIKKLIQISNGELDSAISGFGEPMYILFALLFFGAFPKEKIILFLLSFAGSFMMIFLFTGHYTLFDIGNVCRTISVYENPNTLSVYAVVAGCFFMILALHFTKKWLKYSCVVGAAVAFSAIVNASSRAMYGGLAIACIIFIGVLIYQKGIKKKVIRISVSSVSYIGLFAVAAALFIVIYIPTPDNAIIDTTGKNLSVEESVSTEVEQPTKEDESSDEHDVESDDSLLTGVERLINNDDLSTPAAIKTNVRFVIWQRYLSNVSLDTFFGSEPGVTSLFFEEYGRDYAPHNILLYMLFVHGVIGVCLFMLLLIKLVYFFFKRHPFENNYVILVLCASALIAYGMLHNLANIGIFWCIIGMLNHYGRMKDSNTEEIAKSCEQSTF